MCDNLSAIDEETRGIPGTLLFKLRMRREGKWAAIAADMKARCQMNKPGEQNWLKILQQHGYEGPDREREHLWELEKRKFLGAAETVLGEWADERSRQMIDEEYERVFSELPDKAPIRDELDWIRSHPAMSRKLRQMTDEPVLLTADDLTRSPNGPCPSKSAANRLQNWANNPEGFEKLLLSEDKKKSEDQSGNGNQAGAVKDLGIGDIDAMLASMGG